MVLEKLKDMVQVEQYQLDQIPPEEWNQQHQAVRKVLNSIQRILETETLWFDLAEKTPEPDQKCIVVMKYGDHYYSQHIDYWECFMGEWGFIQYGTKPKYWMPYPKFEPPLQEMEKELKVLEDLPF